MRLHHQLTTSTHSLTWKLSLVQSIIQRVLRQIHGFLPSTQILSMPSPIIPNSKGLPVSLSDGK